MHFQFTLYLFYLIFEVGDFSFAVQQVDTSVLGLSKQDASQFPYIASMGVYVFRTDVLLKLLTSSCPSCNDFGSEIIPSAVKDHNVQVRMWLILLFFFFLTLKHHLLNDLILLLVFLVL